MLQEHQMRHGAPPIQPPDTSNLDLEELMERDLARWEEQELGAEDPRLPQGWNPAWDQYLEDPVHEISEDDYDWDNYDASLAT